MDGVLADYLHWSQTCSQRENKVDQYLGPDQLRGCAGSRRPSTGGPRRGRADTCPIAAAIAQTPGLQSSRHTGSCRTATACPRGRCSPRTPPSSGATRAACGCCGGSVDGCALCAADVQALAGADAPVGQSSEADWHTRAGAVDKHLRRSRPAHADADTAQRHKGPGRVVRPRPHQLGLLGEDNGKGCAQCHQRGPYGGDV